jgi:hypothetical protein
MHAAAGKARRVGINVDRPVYIDSYNQEIMWWLVAFINNHILPFRSVPNILNQHPQALLLQPVVWVGEFYRTSFVQPAQMLLVQLPASCP